MKVTIDRTQEDINKAIKEFEEQGGLGFSTYCPLAQAVKRHLGVTNVGIGITAGHFTRQGQETVAFAVQDPDNTTNEHPENWKNVKPGTFAIKYEDGDGR